MEYRCKLFCGVSCKSLYQSELFKLWTSCILGSTKVFRFWLSFVLYELGDGEEKLMHGIILVM